MAAVAVVTDHPGRTRVAEPALYGAVRKVKVIATPDCQDDHGQRQQSCRAEAQPLLRLHLGWPNIYARGPEDRRRVPGLRGDKEKEARVCRSAPVLLVFAPQSPGPSGSVLGESKDPLPRPAGAGVVRTAARARPGGPSGTIAFVSSPPTLLECSSQSCPWDSSVGRRASCPRPGQRRGAEVRPHPCPSPATPPLPLVDPPNEPPAPPWPFPPFGGNRPRRKAATLAPAPWRPSVLQQRLHSRPRLLHYLRRLIFLPWRPRRSP